MIREVILSTQAGDGQVHLAPMGIHVLERELLVMPFRPSRSLENLLETGQAVVNYCDDVRIFAGCLTGRRDWPLLPAGQIRGQRLQVALAHAELELQRVEDDETRPRLFCRVVHEVCHAPFHGFNRAQAAVLEAAILVSRLRMLPWSKVESELAYLRIALEKTAGERETEAWQWLMARIDQFRAETLQQESAP